MKAAVVKRAGVLEVTEVPEPAVGPYDALCEMRFGATCAGTDIHLTDGKHPFPVTFPTILGHESVGRVISVGNRVRHLKEGDLVTRVGCPALPEAGIQSNWGGFAALGIARDHWQMKRDGVPVEEWNRNRVNQIIHPSIDETTAPMMITWRETLSYTRRIGVSENKKLLVTGSGGNALSFAAMGRNLGATVAVIGSPKKEEAFRKLGVDAYVDYHHEDPGREIRAALSVPSGTQGVFDVAIDAVGNADTMNQVLPLLKQDGVIGVYGWDNRSAYGINPFLSERSFRVYTDGYDEEETHQEVQAMIMKGMLDASLWYEPENSRPLDDITGAYESLRRHEAFKYLIRLYG